MSQSAVRHRLEGPGAGGGVAHKSEVGFAQENELGVAGETPREAVGKAGRERVRQNADAVGAAEAGRKRRRRAAHHIHVRIARRHHAPGALRLHMSRARLEAAGVLDMRPGDAQRAEFRQGRQFVRVGRQPERDQRAGVARRRPRLFKQPQEGHGRRERKGKLLRRASARRMDGARVSDQERPPETLGFATRARSRHGASLERSSRLGTVRAPRPRKGRAQTRPGNPRALRPSARSARQSQRLIGAVGPKIELELRPRIETHAIESLVKRGGVEPSEAKAVGAERAGGHDLQTVRAIGEVVERLGVGLVGIGMIESRDDPPRTAGAKRPGAFRGRIDGFDPNAVRGLGHERFEACALERGFSGPAPIGFE